MTISQQPQPIVENNDGVFSFYRVETAIDTAGNEVQIKKLCRIKTIAQVNEEITKLTALKTKRTEEFNNGIVKIDADIAKQQEYLSLMV